MSTKRRQFTTDQKATILKRCLVDKTPISDLCDEYGIKPNHIYTWQKILFDHAESAFHHAGRHQARKLSVQEEKIARLETKLQQKNEVISELLEGYRRLAFMMLDRDVVAVSPSSVYRALKAAGRIGRSKNKPSKKGTGFDQPQKPHEHWHLDISYINIHGTFYYLTTVLDGYSRYIVHWEIRRSMTEQDELVVLQRAKEKHPNETPRIITDNGSQFLAKDFKEFIRICGMTHVRTSPYYPQSNGKLERFHGSIKGECLRPGTPLSLEDALRIVARYVEHYNHTSYYHTFLCA